MAKSGTNLADQIRRAIEASEHSQYKIAKDLGINQSVLSKFCTKKTETLSIKNTQAILEYLGFTITPPARPKSKKGAK